MWREANSLSVRGTMGYLCGQLKVTQMEKGMLRKRNYDQEIRNEREEIRNNTGRKQPAPIRIVQNPAPVVGNNQQRASFVNNPLNTVVNNNQGGGGG